MKTFTVLSLLSAVAGALSLELPAGVPRSVSEFRQKHPYRSKMHCDRKTVTIRASESDTDDVSDAFLQGIRDANNGGTLYLPKGQTFILGKPLDLTFLNDIHVKIDGTIKFTDDTPYWQEHAFFHPFQTNLLFWKWGGKDIRIYGEGTIDGNGQRWWDEFGAIGKPISDAGYLRPILFYAGNATRLAIEGITMKDSPVWTNLVEASRDILYRDVVVTARSRSSYEPKNTDFFDSLNIERLRVERVWVDIGDDCFSPKSNASGVHVDTMYCNGTHGQSIGSIGQYAGEKSFVEHVLIENVWMLNGQHGGRLKSWAGPDVGYGYMDNITFRNFWSANNEYVAFIDACYFNVNASMCAEYPSKMNITNVLFQNFTGYTSGKYGRAVASLVCSTSPDAVCDNIRFENFDVASPCGGPPVVICDGVTGDLGVPCVSKESDEAKAALKDKCSVPLATLPARPWRA